VTPAIRARGLVKTYGEGRARRRLLDGLDLDVEAGEVVAVLGRSGSGKSTLLHVLGGLDRAEAGTVELAGGRAGFVFQFFHLLPELSGEANVRLATRVKGAARDAPRRAGELIRELGLEHVAHLGPAQLSGGEQQRFALARALVNDPPVVLADEPTGNLDPEAGAQVLALLRDAAAGGRAVVLVTHEDAATAIANRVLRLESGRLVAA
jgi:ABC-type lipoprotein export system ATPase subunit